MNIDVDATNNINSKNNTSVRANVTVQPLLESPHRARITATLQFAADEYPDDLFFRTSDSLRVTVLSNESVDVEPTAGRVKLSPTSGNVTNASVTIEFVQTRPRSRAFDTFVGGDGWQFVDHEFLQLDTALSSDVEVRQRTEFDTDHESLSGNSYTLVGSHATYTRSTSGQDVRLIVPEAASLAEDEGAILDTFAEARRLVPSENVDSPPVLNVFVSPRRTPNQATRGDVFVGADMELGGAPDGLSNLWVHEFTHTRQEFGHPTPRMVWFTEGSATYYEHLYNYRNGYARYGDLHAYPPDVSEQLLSDTLSDRSTWNGRRTPYVKGARVLYALDVKVRNATSGEQTVHDVFRELLAYQENNPGARLSYSRFQRTVERVAGQSLDSWLDRHVTTSAAPVPERRPDLFAPSPPEGDYDGDGISNGNETALGTNPYVDNTDGDLLADGTEVRGTTDPTDVDTNGDGFIDGYDGEARVDARADPDGDGLNTTFEFLQGLDPHAVDSDRDGTNDGEARWTAVGPDEATSSAPDTNTTSAPDTNTTSAPDTDTAETTRETDGPVASYDEGNGVGIQELGEAAADYARGDLSITDLGAVAAAYARS